MLKYFSVFVFLVTLAGSCGFRANDEIQEHSLDSQTNQPQDFVYYVEAQGEFLADIVERFTSDIENVDIIARINALDSKAPLKRGQLIRIPHYMLKKPD
jgi:hypothetical protein